MNPIVILVIAFVVVLVAGLIVGFFLSGEIDWETEETGLAETTAHYVLGSVDYMARYVIEVNKKTGERRAFVYSPKGTHRFEVPVSNIK